MLTDLIGLSAGVMVILASYAREGRALRRCAIGSNLLFIVYAFQVAFWPIFILHVILLPLNVIRLAQIHRGSRRAKPGRTVKDTGRFPSTPILWPGFR